MKVAFLKALRWYWIALLIIMGVIAIKVANETGSVNPAGLTVLGFGFAYVLGASWKEFKGKVLAWGIIVFVAIAFGSEYVRDLIFILFGLRLDMSQTMLWLVNSTLLGIPAMMLVFRKFR